MATVRARLSMLLSGIVFIGALPALIFAPAFAASGSGPWLELSVSAGELRAPRMTSNTDLSAFRGFGVALSSGYRSGRYRLGAEFHLHESSRILTSSASVGVRAIMLNGYVDFDAWRGFGVTLTAGAGVARAAPHIQTCLEKNGCPPDYGADDAGSARAYQIGAGVGWKRGRGRLLLALRCLRTSALGLHSDRHEPFAEDSLDLPHALIGYTVFLGN